MAGLAVRANLLCVTFTAARGNVLLFDMQARRPLSRWLLPESAQGYSDAGGVAMDEHFGVFVADAHNAVVRHYSVFGRHLGDLGHGQLSRPHVVALFGDELLVGGDDQPERRSVVRLPRDGGAPRPLLPAGDPEGWFGAPRGLWADAEGILVADTLHGRILRYRNCGTFVAAVPTAQRRGEASRPMALVRLPDGGILFVDGGDARGLRAVRADGAPQPLPGDLNARCADVDALAFDAMSRLLVLDRHGGRVQRFDRALRFDGLEIDLDEHYSDFPATDRV